MGKTYTNEIDVDEVSLGITHLLLAAKDTAWTPGRINISSPPASFTWMGAVVEDSPVLTVNREKFQIKTGIPRVIQYEQIMGLDGTFKVDLESKDWSKFDYVFANTYTDSSNWATTPNSSSYVIQYYGTRSLMEYVGLGVTDFIDGTQIVHHFHRMSPANEITEQYRPDQEGRAPLNYNLLAKKLTLSSTDELVICSKYTFGPDGTGV